MDHDLPRLVAGTARSVWPTRARFELTRAGNQLFFAGSSGEHADAILVADPSQPKIHRVVYKTERRIAAFGVSQPDGRALVVLERDERHVPHVVAVGPRQTREASGPWDPGELAGYLQSPAASPSGRFALFKTQRRGSDLTLIPTFWFMEIDTGRVASATVPDAEVHWQTVDGQEYARIGDVLIDLRDGTSSHTDHPRSNPRVSPDGHHRFELAGDGLAVIDAFTGARHRVSVPDRCIQIDGWQWLGTHHLAWTDGLALVVELASGKLFVLEPPFGEEVSWSTDYAFDEALRWMVRNGDDGLVVRALFYADAGGPLAPRIEIGGARLDPAALQMRVLAHPSDDAMAREAGAMARGAAEALRAWGFAIGTAIEWNARPSHEIDLAPIAEPLLQWIHRAHRDAEVDGHAGVVESSLPYVEALEAGMRRAEGPGGIREDWSSDIDYRSAVAWGLRVPSDAAVHAGRSFAELPNPFEPVLAVWGTGLLVERMNERGIVLVAAEG